MHIIYSKLLTSSSCLLVEVAYQQKLIAYQQKLLISRSCLSVEVSYLQKLLISRSCLLVEVAYQQKSSNYYIQSVVQLFTVIRIHNLESVSSIKDGVTLTMLQNFVKIVFVVLETNKVKYIKVYIWKGNFSRNLFKWSDFWLKNAFLRNRQKLIFGPNIFEQG